MEKNILEKLKTDYDKINSELANSEVFSDAQKSRSLGKKQKKIEEIINKIERLQKTEKELEGLEEMAKKEKSADLSAMISEEAEKLKTQKEKLEIVIEEDLNPSDPKDARDIIVEIRAGAGGEEAALFAADLFKMYARFAEKNRWQTILLDSSASATGGYKEVIFEINGENVYRFMKYESGVHRVQRIPETEKSGRVHTSTASVAILPQAEEEDVVIKPQDLKFDVFRSGGPGGQNVNKTESAVRITHLPSGLVVKCQDEKSQHKNKEKALKVLRSRLLTMWEEKRDREERQARREQIGTADRSEKIRTYNFPQNRVTDHRIKKNWKDLDKILAGHIDDIISSLKENLNKKQ